MMEGFFRGSLKKKGFATVYTCKSAAGQGGCFDYADRMENFKPELVSYAYQMGEHRYASFRKDDQKDGNMYVSLLVYNYSFDYYDKRFNHPMVQLDVIKAEPLDDSQITVLKARDLSSAIDDMGHVALKGIYFDTDSAALTPDSNEALMEIAKLMRGDVSLKLFVVGHTDNTGGFEHNMDLSSRRAAAVVSELVKQYGVAVERLSAHGVGQLSPVAPNDSEEGRARNRRVELVRK